MCVKKKFNIIEREKIQEWEGYGEKDTFRRDTSYNKIILRPFTDIQAALFSSPISSQITNKIILRPFTDIDLSNKLRCLDWVRTETKVTIVYKCIGQIQILHKKTLIVYHYVQLFPLYWKNMSLFTDMKQVKDQEYWYQTITSYWVQDSSFGYAVTIHKNVIVLMNIQRSFYLSNSNKILEFYPHFTDLNTTQEQRNSSLGFVFDINICH